MEDIEDKESEETIVQKPKKVLTEQQKEQGRINLAKGRASLAEKRRIQKEEDTKTKEGLIIKKAEQLVKLKKSKDKKLKNMIGIDEVEVEVEVEEHIIKKPKRKKIIYREESDSEEEVIVKSRPKQEIKPEAKPEQKQMFSIKFC